MSPVLFPASPVAGRRKTRRRLKGKQYCIISLVHYEHEHSHLSKDLSQLDVKIITPKTFFNGCEIKKNSPSLSFTRKNSRTMERECVVERN